MPQPFHILETSLYVSDLDRSERFYRTLFDFPTLLADARMRAMRIGPSQILLLFACGKSANGDATPRGLIPGHDGTGRLHLALAIDADDVAHWRDTLGRNDIDIISHVRPEQGGESLYLRDPDGHLIELATPGIWPDAHDDA